jgi:hypothetical protein
MGCRENAQAAFVMISHDHRWLLVCFFRAKIAALESLKRVTERIFKIS